MGKNFWAHIVVLIWLGVFLLPSLCQDDSDDATTAVYIVTLRQTPSSHYYSELRRRGKWVMASNMVILGELDLTNQGTRCSCNSRFEDRVLLSTVLISFCVLCFFFLFGYFMETQCLIRLLFLCYCFGLYFFLDHI